LVLFATTSAIVGAAGTVGAELRGGRATVRLGALPRGVASAPIDDPQEETPINVEVTTNVANVTRTPRFEIIVVPLSRCPPQQLAVLGLVLHARTNRTKPRTGGWRLPRLPGRVTVGATERQDVARPLTQFSYRAA
jgi:hypothetical protein